MKQTIKEQKSQIKFKPSIRALYTGPHHYEFSGNWPKKQELVITITGLWAKIIGFILRAEQY
jgi:hypothetical protein